LEDKTVVELAPHQWEAWWAYKSGKYRDIYVFGGVGSGKTFIGDLIEVDHGILNPGTEILIGGKTQNFTETTMRTDFLKWFRDYSKEIKSDIITFWNDTDFHFVHPYHKEQGYDHLAGKNLSSYKIGQAEQFEFGVYGALNERCRNVKADRRFHFFEGNPKGKQHWIYKQAIIGAKKITRTAYIKGFEYKYDIYIKDDSFLLNVPSCNFPWLPEKYVEDNVKYQSERRVARMFGGNWEDYSGLVYPSWDQKVHMIDNYNVIGRLKAPYVRVLSIDWGWANPSGCLYTVYNQRDNVYIIYDCYYKSGVHAEQTAENMLERVHGLNVLCAYIDQSTDADNGFGKIYDVFFAAFRARGIPLIKAQKSSDDTEDMVRRYLFKRLDGSVGLYVMKPGPQHNTNPFVLEIENYSLPPIDESKELKKNASERPLDKDNHLLKPLEYELSGLYHRTGAKVTALDESAEITPRERYEMSKQSENARVILLEEVD
jgi:hypothetical protein